MNFEELSEIISENTSLAVCPICGMPYRRYRSTQKTCAEPDCQKAWHNEYAKRRKKQLREENPELYKQKKREREQRYRDKKKAVEQAEKKIEIYEQAAARIEELNKNVTGIDYGKRQMEKTLALVPKIDVNLDTGGNDK